MIFHAILLLGIVHHLIDNPVNYFGFHLIEFKLKSFICSAQSLISIDCCIGNAEMGISLFYALV